MLVSKKKDGSLFRNKGAEYIEKEFKEKQRMNMAMYRTNYS